MRSRCTSATRKLLLYFTAIYRPAPIVTTAAACAALLPPCCPAGWFSYELKMYVCYQGLVWEMTELAACEGLMRAAHVNGFPFNAHYNPFAR
jgi:hypothetical protein